MTLWAVLAGFERRGALMGMTFGEAMNQSLEGLRRIVDRKLHRALSGQEVSAIHRRGDFIAVHQLTIELSRPDLTVEEAEAALARFVSS